MNSKPVFASWGVDLMNRVSVALLVLIGSTAWGEGGLPAPGAVLDVPVPPPSFEPAGATVTLPQDQPYAPLPVLQEPEMLPTPPGLLPIPEGNWVVPAESAPPFLRPNHVTVELYSRVRIHDRLRKHPLSTPVIIPVPDPRRGSDACVYVEVCLPPCDVQQIRCSRSGNRLVYDFGQYAVVLTSRLGVVHVDYDNRNIRR
jgi:hypothetical protein